jgi:hypothetical protein
MKLLHQQDLPLARGISRRACLRLLAATAVMAGTPRSLRALVAVDDELREFTESMLFAAGQRVGRRYRKQVPHLSMEQIRSDLLQGFQPGGELGDFLDRKIRSDFAAAEVEFLDGWMLSRTELRFYAVLSEI